MEIEKCLLQAMQNRFLILVVFFSNLFFGECNLNSNLLSNFFESNSSFQSEFIQVFEEKEKPNISGEILIKRPNHLKIYLKPPLNSELIINQDYIFQTDFDLDQTTRYEKDAMIDFIPAGFLLLSKEEFCEGFTMDICDNKECVIRQKNNDNKIEIFFKDLKIEQLNFSGPKYDETKILFGNMTLMNDINESAFSYNQEVKDLLIIDKK